MSAFGGKADSLACLAECPLIAISGHQIVYLSASVSAFSMAANTPSRPSRSASPRTRRNASIPLMIYVNRMFASLIGGHFFVGSVLGVDLVIDFLDDLKERLAAA